MSSTQELAAAGIRYRLYISNKSQRWLAKEMGWDVNRISRRLLGRPVFNVEELDRIASILGTDMEGLLSIPADMQKKFFGDQAPTEVDRSSPELKEAA